MVRRKAFAITYAPRTAGHLRAIEPKYLSLIQQTIEEQLRFEPDRETRNRKPLRSPAPFEAGWELRFGPDNRFRAFYDIDPEKHEVEILAVGRKEKNRLIIGEKDREL